MVILHNTVCCFIILVYKWYRQMLSINSNDLILSCHIKYEIMSIFQRENTKNIVKKIGMAKPILTIVLLNPNGYVH